MVEFSDPARLLSREDKTNPSGRLLDLTAHVEEGDKTLLVRWFDKDGDGVVTLGTDQYVEVDASSPHRDETPRRVDLRFITKYKMSIDSYVSTTLYDAMRELNDYFYHLRPLGRKDATLRQATPLESDRCTPTNKTYSYTAEQCAPYTVTDFSIDDQDLPYVTERGAKSVSVILDLDLENRAFSVWLTAFDPQGCPSINSCCSSYDVGYRFEVIGNSPDLRLIESIRRFYSYSVNALDWQKSNGKIYQPGCSIADASNF